MEPILRQLATTRFQVPELHDLFEERRHARRSIDAATLVAHRSWRSAHGGHQPGSGPKRQQTPEDDTGIAAA